MKKYILLGIILPLLAVSCFDDDGYNNEMNIYLSSYFTISEDYYSSYFDADSIYFSSYFTSDSYGWIYLFSCVDDEDGDFLGGVGITVGADTTNYESLDDITYPYRVYGLPANNDGTYGFWHYSGSASTMPSYAARGYLASEDSSCYPQGVYVNNTNKVVNQIRNGLGLDSAFGEDDWLKLTAIGYDSNLSSTGTASIMLADFETYRDSVVTSWTYFDLTDLGAATYLDFELTSSVDDITKDFCMETLTYRFYQLY